MRLLEVPTGISEQCACMVPSARMNISVRTARTALIPPLKLKAGKIRYEVISRIFRPGRTGT